MQFSGPGISRPQPPLVRHEKNHPDVQPPSLVPDIAICGGARTMLEICGFGKRVGVKVGRGVRVRVLVIVEGVEVGVGVDVAVGVGVIVGVGVFVGQNANALVS